jgi:hypothetical protein
VGSDLLDRGANEGRDDIRSKAFAWITTDNAGRDQVHAHQGVGTRGARAGQDEITCVNGRPARLEVDKGVDTLDGCARGQKAAKRAAQAPRPALSRPSGH